MTVMDYKSALRTLFRGKRSVPLEGRRFDFKNDAHPVFSLFKNTFRKPANRKLWKWKYLPPWTGQIYAWVGLAKGQVIGYIGAVPLRGVINGDHVLFFQLADIMVAPGSRSLMNYPQFTPTKLIDDIRLEHPQAVLYGFTSRKLARFYTWYASVVRNTYIGKANEQVVRLTQKGSGGSELDHVHIQPWSWDAPELDDIWQKQKETIKVGLIRDRTYLNWRYAKHPVVKYSLFGVYHHDVPVGWFVTGKRCISKKWDEEVRIHDMLIPHDIRLPALQKAALVLHANSLVLWFPDNCVASGLENRDTGWQIMYHVSSPTISKEFLAHNIYYTLGEVDEWWW